MADPVADPVADEEPEPEDPDVLDEPPELPLSLAPELELPVGVAIGAAITLA